ncbi:MAG: prepilin peptidase [Kiritimatiellia bacterium]
MSAIFWIPTVFVALFGSCIGSFLNVCIWRIPLGMSIVRPGSHCPRCEHPIPFWQNIPVLSWFALRGRCHYCKEPISIRYPLVEALVALLFLLVWFKFAIPPTMDRPILGLTPFSDPRGIPVYLIAVSGLVFGSFVDIDHLILPDRVTLGGMILGLLASPLVPELQGADTWQTALLRSVVGLVAGFGGLRLVSVLGSLAFRKEAMGFGDVKLMGAIGALCGWQAVIFTLLAASLAGSIVGLALVACGRRKLRGQIPFGPFLALGAIGWIGWGPTLVNWYLSLLSLPS